MANNAKEEINFHDFLKVMRKARHATLEQLSEGLCSVSMMKRIESGERLPEKLMRDRILLRLGVALEKYEDYLSEEEYEQWKLRQKILINIQRRKISDAEQYLAEYEKVDNRNVVEQQFCEAMKLVILQLKKTSVSLQQEVIEHAVKLTIPSYKEGLSESILLSEQEINLLIEYLRMQPYESMSVSEFEYRLKQYKDLIVYIRHSKIDKLGRAKIYPKAVYDMCEMILYQSKTKENLQYGLDVCIQAIEVLRDTGKLYYFIELLDVQQKIGKEIINYSEKEEQEKLAVILEEGQEWKKVLLEFYMEYDVSPYMEDFCYLYWETESYCIGDVIRIRRKMLGLSKKQLCAGICSEKTLTRIESKKAKTQMSIVRELFERLGLCAEYVRTRVISNNYEIMLLADELAWNVNNRRTREWEMSINQLEKKLCMGLMQNRQFLMVAKNALELYTEKITIQEYIQKMLKSLEATISPSKAITPGEKFLTREEIDHIFNIGTRMSAEANNPYMQVIREICEKYQKEGELEIHISKYEFLGTGLCSYLGNIGEFDTSDDYSNILIKESLKQRRMSSLAKNIYNNYWNNKQRELKNVPIWDVYNGEKELERCVLFAKLNKRENDVKFYEKKLREM